MFCSGVNKPDLALCVYWTSGSAGTAPVARSNLTRVEIEVDWNRSSVEVEAARHGASDRAQAPDTSTPPSGSQAQGSAALLPSSTSTAADSLPACPVYLPLHLCRLAPTVELESSSRPSHFETRPSVRASVTASKSDSLARCWV